MADDSTENDAAAAEVRSQNLKFLGSQTESWFGVLFNLFTSTGVTKDERGPIGDVIRVWCGVSSSSVGHFLHPDRQPTDCVG